MDSQHPIYTLTNECQDCYKCVRHCPVKAIRVEGGHASIVPELCVACGYCVTICPAKAKKVRDDLSRARHLLSQHQSVYVSLAPSWVNEFPDADPAQMVAAVKALGFAGVGETALGAQEVSATLAAELRHAPAGLMLSSACPAVVEFIQKYEPEAAKNISPVFSPALAHCKILRREFGEDIAVVFIGPCIAKKREADRRPDLMNLALTFEDLRRWFEMQDIWPGAVSPTVDDRFVPDSAEEGALYPVEGGMIETIKAYGGFDDVEFVTVTGLHRIDGALTGLSMGDLDRPVFIECLACEGGCVNGPCSIQRTTGLSGRMRVVEKTQLPEGILDRKPVVDIGEEVPAKPAPVVTVSEEQILKALRRVGKTEPADELNCGGCGYNSCREFAAALVEGKAEPAMCVSYLRRLALKKANALLRCMPSGVVIVDADLRIIEGNEPFARIFGEEVMCAFNASPGLASARIEKVAPFADLFRAALQSGQDIQREHMHVDGKLLNVTVFTIEPHQVVGAIVWDVTKVELHREQIAKRARDVIEKNLATVQDIACCLGEHMADTEILLRSIADDYADEPAKGSYPETR